MVQDNSRLKLTIYWGDTFYDTVICDPKDTITVGRKPSNTFVMDLRREGSDENESFKLLDVFSDQSATLYFDDQTDGHIRVGKEMLSLKTARTSKYVERNELGQYKAHFRTPDKADVVIGHVSFYLDWIAPGEPLPHTPVFEKRNLFLAFLGLLLLLILISAIQMIKPEEPEKPPERLITLESVKKRTSPPADVPVPATEAPSKAAMGKPKTADGGAQKGEAGKAATKTPDKISAVSSLRKANLGSSVSGLTTMGANAPSTNNQAGAVEAPIAQQGTGGFTTEGLKNGGGGKSVGIGRTIGQGEGGFSGTGKLGIYGNSAVEGSGRGAGGGGTKVAGGLDRNVIESIIRRRLDRIRLCYERQLNFFPRLSGKISIHFVIDKNGSVKTASISEDTMKNDAVRSCILNEVQTWTFPNPEGGTLVNVDYPFIFESSAKGK